MRTSEMIAMLEKNPELRFVKTTWQDATNLVVRDYRLVLMDSKTQKVFARGERTMDHLDVDANWQLVREPIPPLEAIQALLDGKKISVECDDCAGSKDFCHFHKDEDDSICTTSLIEGKWYIDES
jgi:hypothetical protein